MKKIVFLLAISCSLSCTLSAQDDKKVPRPALMELKDSAAVNGKPELAHAGMPASPVTNKPVAPKGKPEPARTSSKEK